MPQGMGPAGAREEYRIVGPGPVELVQLNLNAMQDEPEGGHLWECVSFQMAAEPDGRVAVAALMKRPRQLGTTSTP